MSENTKQAAVEAMAKEAGMHIAVPAEGDLPACWSGVSTAELERFADIAASRATDAPAQGEPTPLADLWIHEDMARDATAAVTTMPRKELKAAYIQARDDLAQMKRRALEAEAKLAAQGEQMPVASGERARFEAWHRARYPDVEFELLHGGYLVTSLTPRPHGSFAVNARWEAWNSALSPVAATADAAPAGAVAALELAMTICDAVPTRAHLSDNEQLAQIGRLVNAQDDGTHGYAVIRDALNAAKQAQVPHGAAVGSDGAVYHNIAEIYHLMEEGEALHMVLDDQGVPRADADGKVYSLVGRVAKLSKSATTEVPAAPIQKASSVPDRGAA